VLAWVRQAVVNQRTIRTIMVTAGTCAVVVIHVIMARATEATPMRFTLVYFSAIIAIARESFIASAVVMLPVNAAARGVLVARRGGTRVNFGHMNFNCTVERLRGDSIIFSFYQDAITSKHVIVITKMRIHGQVRHVLLFIIDARGLIRTFVFDSKRILVIQK